MPTTKKPRVAKILSNAPPAYAVIDLGTNSCRLLIARYVNDKINIIDSFSDSISLGKGINKTQEISEKAIERAIQCLIKIKNKIDKHNIIAISAVATETCRRAKNGKKFISEIYEKTGIKFKIIDTKEESELAVAGCYDLYNEETNVVFDIGGGSTQIMLVKNNNIIDYVSIPYGVLTLTEKINKTYVNEQEFIKYQEYIQSYLNKLSHNNINDVNIVGTSGTITTIASTYLGLKTYKRNLIDGVKVKQNEIMKLAKKIAQMQEKERMKIPSINHKYSKLMMAGCIILYSICKKFKTDYINVADRGIREGMLKRLLKND